MEKIYDSTDLGKPFWMMLRDSKPQRDKSIIERIKELKEQRELIDIEIRMLQLEINPKQSSYTGKSTRTSRANKAAR